MCAAPLPIVFHKFIISKIRPNTLIFVSHAKSLKTEFSVHISPYASSSQGDTRTEHIKKTLMSDVLTKAHLSQKHKK